MKNFINKFRWFISGGLTALFLSGGVVYAVQVSVPSAPLGGAANGGYLLLSTSTGNYIASSTATGVFGNFLATSTRVNIFPYASSTGVSTSYASSTALHIGTGQGFLYTGSGQKVNAVATSSISLSGFNNDLASLTATNATLTFSGSYNGSVARTVGLNLGNSNTWTVLQTFSNSTTSLASFTYASTTQLRVGSGQGYGYIGSNGLFGVVSTSTLASNLTSLCATITGSADLCDGDDATGGGSGSVSTSTVDYIIYKKGSNTVVYDTITNTDVLTTTTFGAACNYIINNATSTFPARTSIAVRSGYYNAGADCIIDGNSNQYGPTFDFQFTASSTEIYVASGINAFRFQNQASVNITNLTCGVVGTATCLFATTTSGTQSSLRESYIKGLMVHATTTHTGWAVDLINPFRNHFESVDLKFVANGVREQCNTSGFNCGDTTYERGFTEILNSSIGYMVKMEGNAGTHNQNTFIDWNGISNDTNDVMWYWKKSNWNRVLSSNAEEFATTTEYYNSNSNVFISNKYMNLGNSGGTVMYNDANSYNNTFECKYVEVTAATVLMRDLNSVATTRPNAWGNFSGGTCTIGDDGGSATFSTTTTSVVDGIHDNTTGALNYLNSIRKTGSKLFFNWQSGVTTFMEYIGSALRFTVGGTERLTMTSTNTGIGSTTPGYSLSVAGAGYFTVTSGTLPVLTAIVDSSGATQNALFVGNRTNFAHSGTLANFKMSNSTDTGRVVQIDNAGSGASLYVAGGFSAFGTTTPWLRSVITAVGTTTIQGQLVSLAASTTANTTQTINWSSGNTQKIMLTGNTTIVMNATSSNPIDGGKYTLRICQDGTGSRTLTWANPVSLRWTNGTTTITSTANKCTFIGFIYTAENGNSVYSGIASSTNIDIR